MAYTGPNRKILPLGWGKSVFAHLLDQNLKARAPNYLFQCGLATASLIVILLVEDAVFRAAIVVAVASTAFIIFVVPNSIAASPRRVVGGHVVAVAVGSIFSSVLMIPALESAAVDRQYIVDVMAALSVGVAILVMVSTDTEHPPAAGTALGLVIYGSTWSAVVFILSGAVILTIVRFALRSKIINLL